MFNLQEPEDISPLQRHRPYNLRVTDLRDQAWCEKQLEFTLEEGRVETAAMRAGSERHQALHEEIAEIIEVQPQTREDMWGLHFWNAWTGLQLLCESGLGREIPVIGLLNDQWVVGIIDELHADDSGEIRLIDTKTRQRPSLPRIEQKHTTRYQMAIYKHLFDQMASGDFPTKAFFHALGLSAERPFSEIMLKEMQHDLLPKNLGELVPIVLSVFSGMPQLSSDLVVRYEWQEDHSLLGTDEFPYREDWLMHRAVFHIEYWRGERMASGVPPREGWKCRFCQFQSKCSLSPQNRSKRST